MVSLYIPANAKLVAAASSAADAYVRLRNRGYLSIRALMNKPSVETLIQDTWDSFPEEAAPGQESSRDVIESLRRAGYLSILGQTWGGRPQNRGPDMARVERADRVATAGGVYSVFAGNGTYRVAKVLLVEPGVVHVRLYKGRSKQRPATVDLASLRLGRFDEPGAGFGHLPLWPPVFASWQPELLTMAEVKADELNWYDAWKRAGGGVWRG